MVRTRKTNKVVLQGAVMPLDMFIVSRSEAPGHVQPHLTAVYTRGSSQLASGPKHQRIWALWVRTLCTVCRLGLGQGTVSGPEKGENFHRSRDPTIHCDWGNPSLYLDKSIAKMWCQLAPGSHAYGVPKAPIEKYVESSGRDSLKMSDKMTDSL